MKTCSGCKIPNLEGQFTQGMTWENWTIDGWHIDHKISFAFFDLTNREQLLLAVHYTNLQPMWANKNLTKGKKVSSVYGNIDSTGNVLYSSSEDTGSLIYKVA